jgi:hypothetical protein
MKLTKYTITGIIAAFLILTAGMVLAENQGEQNQKIQPLNRAVIKIDSLSNDGSFAAINAGLAPMKGFSGIGANLFRKLIAVDFAAPLTAEEIAQKISELGFLGKLESVDTISQRESFAYIETLRGSGGGGCGGGSRNNNNTASNNTTGNNTGSEGCGGSNGGGCGLADNQAQNNTPATQKPLTQNTLPATGASCCSLPGASPQPATNL